VLAFAGCGSTQRDWSVPNGDHAGTRAAQASTIDSGSVSRLAPAWRFGFTVAPRESGVATATPVVAQGVVYEQDMESNVVALRARDGHVIWQRRFGAGTPGPNGLSVDGKSVYGSTDTTVFALRKDDGTIRWSRRILGTQDSFVDVAPLAAEGLVYTATTGYGPGTRPRVYALDERTGAIRWSFRTIARRWAHPDEAGGGGVWETPTLEDGELYVGTANPLPWGGSAARPNGGAYPGRALYTDALLALGAYDGALRWYDQVTPHDLRDHDLQNPPIVSGPLVIGSGKGGRIVAWNRKTHQRVWTAVVGRHVNDVGNLPRAPVVVCPGLLGGVETPGAVADGRMFVAVVDLCHRESSTGAAAASFAQTRPESGRGEVVALDSATGRRLWQVPLPSPPFACTTVANDVVFVPTYDGRIRAFAARTGALLWQTRVGAGINACPSVSGDTLYVAAGAPERSFARPRFELVAYRLAH